VEPRKRRRPASLRSLAGDYPSVMRADDFDNLNSIDQNSPSCKAELSEGLTEFLLKKIIQLRARLQPEFTLSGQGGDQTRDSGERYESVHLGPALGIA
jgi:hypothetical protein